MRKFQVCFLFVAFVGTICCQTWVGTNIPATYTVYGSMASGRGGATYVDTVSNKIYQGSAFNINTNGGMTIGVYDGNTWGLMDTFNNSVSGITIYNNELYVCGPFSYIDSMPMPGIAKWNGIQWIRIADSVQGVIEGLKVFNGELYAFGQFSKIDTLNTSDIAKWDGTHWAGFNFPGDNGPIQDFAFYQGDMYVGGNFTSTIAADMLVLRAATQTWEPVGTTDVLKGGYTGVSTMAVYKNELYVGGTIAQDDGNVGNGIQKWNGNHWSVVGTGVQDINNGNHGYSEVLKMEVYKEKLYVSGSFANAGNIPARAIASWDGNQWCGFDRNFNKGIQSFCIFRDSLYISTNVDTLEHVYVDYFAKFNKGDYNYMDTCSVDFSGIKQVISNRGISIYPNPATEHISIQESGIENIERATVVVQNTLGQIIWQQAYTASMDVGGLAKGCYFIQLVLPGGQAYKGKFIKE